MARQVVIAVASFALTATLIVNTVSQGPGVFA
jgi:hypothetical protein